MKEPIYSKKKWELVNPENKALLEDFVLEMRSNKKSPGTIRQYTYDIKMIYCYLLDEMDNCFILDMRKKDFRNIKMWLLEEREVSSARCNRVLSVLHAFLDFVEADDEYEYINQSKKVKGVLTESVRDILFLEDDLILRLRNKLYELRKYKHMCLLDFLYDSAGRRSEICQVKKSGLLERNYTNIVVGKGGKQFPLVYFDRTKESVELYLGTRSDDLEELWVTSKYKNVRACSHEALYRYILDMREILSDMEGRFVKINVHTFRHSCLENLSNGSHYVCKQIGKEEGFSLEELKVFAHHSDTGTTEKYLKRNDNNVLEVMFEIKIA